ncbi:MAG: hypothetical protein ACRC92_11305 [Peptostreptococcaceae bacterium]
MIMTKKFNSLQELIAEYANDDYMTSSLAFLDEDQTVHIMDTYRHIFESNTITITLSDADKSFFRYNPHALSQKIYKTQDLWFIILHMNNMTVAGDLTCEGELKLFNPTNLRLLDKMLENILEIGNTPDMTEKII